MKTFASLLLSATFALPALAEDAAALRKLGFRYYDGRGVKQDIAKGVALFERAAAAGDIESQSNLCVMYDMAIFVPQDYGRAAAWCLKAAEQGDPPSQFRFAELAYLGRGVPRDKVEAFKWLSVMQLTLPAERLAGFRPTIEMVEAKLTPAELVEARGGAESWVANRSAR